MIDAMGTAARGMADGVTRLARAADGIARDAESTGTASSMVELRRARHQVAANAVAFRTADETIGTLLDVLA